MASQNTSIDGDSTGQSTYCAVLSVFVVGFESTYCAVLQYSSSYTQANMPRNETSSQVTIMWVLIGPTKLTSPRLRSMVIQFVNRLIAQFSKTCFLTLKQISHDAKQVPKLVLGGVLVGLGKLTSHKLRSKVIQLVSRLIAQSSPLFSGFCATPDPANRGPGRSARSLSY